MVKKIIYFLVVFLIGVVGGIFSQIFLPYMVKVPLLANLQFIKNLEREIVINPVQQIIVEQSSFLENSIEKTKDLVLEITSKNAKGCGFALTSDGQILVSASLLGNFPPNVISINQEQVKFTLLKKDQKLDLALLKVEKSGFKTIPFFALEKLKIGSSVFILTLFANDGSIKKKADFGLVKNFDSEAIELDTLEKENISNCPAFSIDAKFLGWSRASLIKNLGLYEVYLIPSNKIREFAGI